MGFCWVIILFWYWIFLFLFLQVLDVILLQLSMFLHIEMQHSELSFSRNTEPYTLRNSPNDWNLSLVAKLRCVFRRLSWFTIQESHFYFYLRNSLSHSFVYEIHFHVLSTFVHYNPYVFKKTVLILYFNSQPLWSLFAKC